jgi:hypothetical protein
MNTKIEHFCTLFDINFLPMGMTLHSSLINHAQPFHLWIICMDELVEKQLQKLALPYVTLISLTAIETPELLTIKSERNKGEYCWTITSFTFTKVFELDYSINRVTYLDADLFFFRDPKILIKELEDNNRNILITEHAYDPKYDQTHISGRFCVQFITVNNHPEAIKVIKWWQNKCLEWCFSRLEDGKFGDQKYLDSWIYLFPEQIWILQQKENTLAPWNVKYFTRNFNKKNLFFPVFYHFHGLRIINDSYILLYLMYQIGMYGNVFYEKYIEVFKKNIETLKNNNYSVSPLYPTSLDMFKGFIGKIRKIKFLIESKIKFVKL